MNGVQLTDPEGYTECPQCYTCRWFRPYFKGSTPDNPAFGGGCAWDDNGREPEGSEMPTIQPTYSCENWDVSRPYE